MVALLFIDRYLVTTNAYKIPTILIFNKIDNYTEEDKVLENEYKKIYTKIRYVVLNMGMRITVTQ